MIDTTKWFNHYIRTLIPDFRSEQTSYTEAFSTNEVTLAHPAVSYVSSVTTASGNNTPGYGWWFKTWGTKTASTVLKASGSDTISSVTYKAGTSYCYPGFAQENAVFPRVHFDYSAGVTPIGSGQHSSTSEHSDKVDYQFSLDVYGRTGENKQAVTINSVSYNEHQAVDKLVEVLVEGIQKKGTGAGNGIPYPFVDLQVTNIGKYVYEEVYGVFHKDITVKGWVPMNINSGKW